VYYKKTFLGDIGLRKGGEKVSWQLTSKSKDKRKGQLPQDDSWPIFIPLVEQVKFIQEDPLNLSVCAEGPRRGDRA
jgi:hypothetical protein